MPATIIWLQNCAYLWEPHVATEIINILLEELLLVHFPLSINKLDDFGIRDVYVKLLASSILRHLLKLFHSFFDWVALSWESFLIE